MDLDNFSDSTFHACIELIHRLTGITVSTNRKSMVHGRLRKRVSELQVVDYEDYLKLVSKNDNEQLKFIDLVTTNETYFYRTPRIWEYIEKELLPAWQAKNHGRPFQAWSAAASSGEEAHTLGLILQNFKEKSAKFDYRIFGTDISEAMIRRCECGHYEGKSIDSIRKLRPELFAKYMKALPDTDQYRIRDDIKQHLRFKQHNLFKTLSPPNKFDLILIRNVLIYFQKIDQEKVIRNLEPSINTDGTLIIGESETLNFIDCSFSSSNPLIYQLVAKVSGAA
jgi:chemotaxis protein methyltransferase CheR